MTPTRTINLLRLLFALFMCFLGTMIGTVTSQSALVGGMIGLAFGLGMVLVDRLLKGFTLRAFSSATFGLLLGLLFAQLLLRSDILRHSSENTIWIASLVVYSTFGYLGMMLAMRSNRDEFSLIIPYVRFRQTDVQDTPLLLDTNIIIDGRIRQVCDTGFVSGTIVVPAFVVEELQILADSRDGLKRERGRRGLDELQKMQADPVLSISIDEHAPEPGIGVDTRLIHLAKLIGARILSNDTDLGKAARLQGLVVLNLIDLAHALRPTLNAGDDLNIALIKEGRDAHQAVGYLNDGTMVVVNHARQQLGETVRIRVASTTQTSAGRLFFAELVHADEAETSSAREA